MNCVILGQLDRKNCVTTRYKSPTGDTGDRGQGKGRAGRGERPQVPRGGRGEKRRRGGEEQRQNRVAAQRGKERGGGATTTRRRKTAEKERGRRIHEQMSSNGNRGERCKRRDGQEESDEAIEGWSGKSVEDLAGS